MSFDELQSKWQSHDHGSRVNLDADLLLTEVHRNHRALESSLLQRDLVEVVASAIVTGFFGYVAVLHNEWSLYLCSLGGLFVGVFLIVDRWIQHRRRPVSDASLQSCIQASLVQVNHQIWLLKNIIWWYLMPPSIGVVAFLGSSAWKARDADWVSQLTLAVIVFIGVLTFWGVYWLNQRAVRKTFEPRRNELESLLASLERGD